MWGKRRTQVPFSPPGKCRLRIGSQPVIEDGRGSSRGLRVSVRASSSRRSSLRSSPRPAFPAHQTRAGDRALHVSPRKRVTHTRPGLANGELQPLPQPSPAPLMSSPSRGRAPRAASSPRGGLDHLLRAFFSVLIIPFSPDLCGRPDAPPPTPESCDSVFLNCVLSSVFCLLHRLVVTRIKITPLLLLTAHTDWVLPLC